jgi:hypothetical protein
MAALDMATSVHFTNNCAAVWTRPRIAFEPVEMRTRVQFNALVLPLGPEAAVDRGVTLHQTAFPAEKVSISAIHRVREFPVVLGLIWNETDDHLATGALLCHDHRDGRRDDRVLMLHYNHSGSRNSSNGFGRGLVFLL